jgi:DNA polymerase I-like protein with 3'-5' exonuclease and polymerase domains
MDVLTIDLETHLITSECLTPRIVSAAWKHLNKPAELEIRNSAGSFSIYEHIEKHLANPDALLNGQNISYDLACLVNENPSFLPVVYAAYERGQIFDTQIADKLLGIATGAFEKRKSSLDVLCKRYLGFGMVGKSGDDIWRIRYGELDGVNLEEWPKAARDYAENDVNITEQVFKHLYGARIENWADQCYAAWSLHLISVYGMRINQGRADRWVASVEEDYEKARAFSKQIGILRPNGTKNLAVLREIIAEAYNGSPPLTDKGSVKTDGETCKSSGDERLLKYAEGRFCEKLKTTYAPILTGSQIVRPRYNVLVKSGRTSCAKPNMQNPPREGKFREVFEPRPGGWVFVLCDYDQIELLALAQCHIWLFGSSSIADAVNEGRDLHLEVAAKLNPDDPQAYRQASKAANYGFAGGLGSEAFRNYAKGLGLDISEDDAADIRAAWLETWPEMRKYFNLIGKETQWGGADVKQFVSGRIRGACTFTQYANTLFQGLVADAAKRALTAVSRACYVDTENPLFGSRPVAFLHDEIILESLEENAPQAAAELSRIMIEKMREYIPDVAVGASPYISRVWSKKAGPVYNDAGELVPWEP